MTFIHLRVRTSYSLLESALPIGTIAKACVADSMPAVGITDTGNLFGALEASDKLASAGVQPIIGTTVEIEGWGTIALLAQSDVGYANLCRISSEAHLRPAGGRGPSVAPALLASLSDGLLALSGGPRGAIGTAIEAGALDLARQRLHDLLNIYGDRLYVEIQRYGLPGEWEGERQALELAYATGAPIVATHEALFRAPDDYEAHDVLLAISAGKRIFEDDRPRASREQWLQPQADMKALFADLPEAIENTVEIARRCAARPRGRKPLLPHFSDDEAAELRQQAREGLARRLEAGPAAGFEIEDYRRRLEYECDVIERMKFPGYFLIVADFIRWAKAAGIPVGPGRGSGAGSVVAWSLTITDLDPLRFGLLFERFLNPERVSMPDFDVDFCQERREEVIRYVQGRYGADRVAQIITHGKLQARAVLRDVGRALSMPYGQVDRICKLVPNNPANPVTIAEAIEIEPRLAEERDSDPTTARLIETAQRLEGLFRHASTHAAGLVIGDRPLQELVPLYRDTKSDFPITQFNMKIVEQAGLVKFDFLGLKTLTVIRKTLEQIRAGRGVEIDISTLPLDDRPTFELLAKADTVGVFQLESTGMRDALRQLRPDRFEDIIAMVALYRPGPMDNIPSYVARKCGRESIEYPHDLIAPILEETYGVIIYQEQVIQIAQTLSGYTLGQADLLRRAMGKKDKDEMARQRARFVDGAIANGVEPDLASEIFDLVDKFAGYGFNKSHAAAYALISYQTAYLKANYREEFLTASMTLDMSDTEKLALFAREARRAGVVMAPPCVIEGETEFRAAPSEQSRIIYALAGLKNVGAGTAAAIVSERKRGGPYKSLTDFCRRIDPTAMTKRTVEMLASAGAFDALEPNRAAVYDGASAIIAFAKKEADDRRRGVMDLFGGLDGGSRMLELPEAHPWSAVEACQAEHAAIGHYVSGHPLDGARAQLTAIGVQTRPELVKRASAGKVSGKVAAVFVSIKSKISQKGTRFGWLSLSDEVGDFEAVIFEDALNLSEGLLVTGSRIVAGVTVERSGDGARYLVRTAETVEEAIARTMRGR